MTMIILTIIGILLAAVAGLLGRCLRLSASVAVASNWLSVWVRRCRARAGQLAALAAIVVRAVRMRAHVNACIGERRASLYALDAAPSPKRGLQRALVAPPSIFACA
jgi:hypothetical protein